MQEKLVRSNSKSKSTKAGSKTSKNTLPLVQTVHSGSKHGPPPVPVAAVRSRGTSSIPILPQHFRQNDSDAKGPDTTPRVTSSSRRVADKVHNNDFLRRRVDHLASQKSDSELSSLVDEPPKKKARGKSKVGSAFPPPHPDPTLHSKHRTQKLGNRGRRRSAPNNLLRPSQRTKIPLSA
jgi:hypothetical protein